MKNTIFLSITILVALLMSGCGSKEITFNQKYIDRNANTNIHKINTLAVSVNDHSSSKITRKLNNLSISAVTYELYAAEINKNVMHNFFSQYFTDTHANPKNAVFTVNSEILDYSIFNSLNPNNQNVTLKLHVDISKGDKVILSKTYDKKLEDYIILTWDLTPTADTFEKIHKGLFALYDNEIKNDLLAALKENQF